MFVSTKRIIALLCVVSVFATVAGYHLIKHFYHSDHVEDIFTNGKFDPLSALNPFWTTEQDEPRFAYVQYATDKNYLCSAVINFNRLHRFAADHDQVLVIPNDWLAPKSKMAKAIEDIRTTNPDLILRPRNLLTTSKGESTWHKSLTKFHAFDLTDYTRILAFDSDSLVLNNMDHYFLAPLAPVAVPRAYWLGDKDMPLGEQVLGSHVMLIEPNKARYEKIVQEAIESGDFDMEVLNHMFKDSAMILPHRRLALLTGEFRASDHQKYLAPDQDEEWNAMAEASRAYLVHFSDWPLPKPWISPSDAQWKAALPACPEDEQDRSDRPRCADRTMWEGFYQEYRDDMDRYCKSWK